MARGGGWPALFRGNAVNVMRSGPSKALDFFAFDNFKRLLGGSDDPISPLATFAAAGLAGASSWTMLYPLEVGVGLGFREREQTLLPGMGSGRGSW
jgi:hypothetical protein